MVINNVMLVAGTGTGKTHLATTLGRVGSTQHGKAKCYSSMGWTRGVGPMGKRVPKLHRLQIGIRQYQPLRPGAFEVDLYARLRAGAFVTEHHALTEFCVTDALPQA